MIQSRDNELAERCINLWLNGVPREEIGQHLGISEGGVANIVDYFSKNDNSLQLQRQLALYIKKTGTDVFQLASDIRFVTALKRRSAEVNSIEVFLSNLQKEFDLAGITQQNALDAIVGISEACIQENTPINKIFQQIDDGYGELERAKSEVAKQKKELEMSTIELEFALVDNNSTLDSLTTIRKIRRKLRKRGMSFSDAERTEQTLNVISNLKSLEFHEQKIINTFSKITSAKDELTRLHEQCQEVLSHLEQYRISLDRAQKQWGKFAKGVEDFGAAMQMGLNPGHLLAAAAVFHKHLGNFTPEQILADMENYGNLSAALFRLKLEVNKLETQNDTVWSS